MSAIRLVAIDVDGTLLSRDNTISEQNRRAVQRCTERGIVVMIASMRSLRNVRMLYEELNIMQSPVICGGGARVLSHPEGELWASHPIPVDSALAIARHADEQEWSLNTLIDETAYSRLVTGQSLGQLDPYHYIVSTNVEAVTAAPFRMLSYQRHILPGLQQLTDTNHPDCRIEVFHKRNGQFQSLVVLSAKADKGSALATVTERLGIAPDQVMAIGDHYNDLPMFAFAGAAVAMGNAPEKVKAQASVTAPDHNHSGVAWALETLVLGD